VRACQHRQGQHGVLSACPALAGRAPLEVLAAVAAEGVGEVILLALSKVGTGAGPDLQTLRAARLRLVSGGGVRTPDDLSKLAAAGADGVLLATALHRAWITAPDIAAVRAKNGGVTSAP
jgi:uncharacterized protein related to proFAR isomerase